MFIRLATDPGVFLIKTTGMAYGLQLPHLCETITVNYF